MKIFMYARDGEGNGVRAHLCDGVSRQLIMQKFRAFPAISIFVQFPKGSLRLYRGIDTDRTLSKSDITRLFAYVYERF